MPDDPTLVIEKAASLDETDFTWLVDRLDLLAIPCVYVVDLDCLADLPEPTADERAKAQAYGDPVWGQRFLVRRAAARLIASRLTGQPAADIALDRDASGALHFVPPIAGLHVSISHRGPYAALAFAPDSLGVDLEDLSDFSGIPWNVLHRNEIEALQALPEDRQPLAFARLWTVKEAYLKALGLGLGREPSSFAVIAEEGTFRIEDPLTSGRPLVMSTRVISALGASDLVVACVTFPAR